MTIANITKEQLPTKVYRLSKNRRTVLRTIGIVMLVGLLLILFSALITEPLTAFGVFVVAVIWPLFIAAAIHVIWLADNMRIEMSPDGIEYHGSGYCVVSKWSNVKQVGLVPGGSKFVKVNGLVLHEPSMLVSKFIPWGKWTLRRNGYDKIIPLQSFSLSDNDNLLQDIKQYAPHLNINE